MSANVPPGFVLWLTGLPSSGKTTLARELVRLLGERGIAVQVLDSDALRQVLTPKPSYSAEERDWFYDALGYIAALLAANGVNVIVAATGPRTEHREAARRRVERFAEVYLRCPVEVCRRRDPKGLWQRSDEGKIVGLPGAGAPYEPPAAPDARVDTARLSPPEAAHAVMAQLDAGGFWQPGGSRRLS